MSERKHFTITDRMKAFGYAISGLIYVFKTQHAMWFHCLMAGVVIALGVNLHIAASDWRWLVLAITLVWSAEAMNTAVELVADAFTREHHPLIGKAKDVAAGAVLVAVIGAAIIGILVFWPYFF